LMIMGWTPEGFADKIPCSVEGSYRSLTVAALF